MKKMETYLPLQIIQEYSELALLSWDVIDQWRAELINIGQSWQEGTYIPAWGILMGLGFSP